MITSFQDRKSCLNIDKFSSPRTTERATSRKWIPLSMLLIICIYADTTHVFVCLLSNKYSFEYEKNIFEEWKFHENKYLCMVEDAAVEMVKREFVFVRFPWFASSPYSVSGKFNFTVVFVQFKRFSTSPRCWKSFSINFKVRKFLFHFIFESTPL